MSGHEKTRAVVLTAMMVLSVFGATVAFTGMAAAEEIPVSGGDGLQNAIDNAESGDIITVTDSERYGGILVTTDNLTIRAADGENPIIIYDGSPEDAVVRIEGDSVTLEGFTVDAAGLDENTGTVGSSQSVAVSG